MSHQEGSSDLSAGRLLALLIAALLGFAVRAVWDAYVDRRSRKRRDRAVLTAMLIEIHVMRGLALSIISDLQKERALLAQEPPRWRVNPFARLPTTFYDLVRLDIPAALVEQEHALVDILRIQHQAEFTNAVLAAQERFKVPGSTDAEVIADFHGAITDSVETVIKRLDPLEATVRKAGDKLGGIKASGVPE